MIITIRNSKNCYVVILLYTIRVKKIIIISYIKKIFISSIKKTSMESYKTLVPRHFKRKNEDKK